MHIHIHIYNIFTRLIDTQYFLYGTHCYCDIAKQCFFINIQINTLSNLQIISFIP